MIDLYPVVIHVHSVYVNRLYQQVVPESMKAAVECVKVSPWPAIEDMNNKLL